MEANGIAVVPTEAGYDVWVSTQIPFDVRDDLAELLGVDRDRVHTIAPDVGGGFGAKVLVYPEYLVVARAAQLLQRPVRWFETRSESMLSLWHGRGQVQHVEIGARSDGTLVGLRVDIVADMGAYPLAAFLPTTTGEMLAGVYRIPKVAYRGRAIVTNATPIGAYRGAGRPEAAACIERAVDLVATELGLDPVDVRRRNLIPPDAFPYTTAAGATYDSGDYGTSLDEALRLASYDDLREQQRERRRRDDHLLLGIGVSTYVEITSFSSKEFAQVDVEADGTVTVYAGTSSHGQGHETAFAQLASGTLGLPLEAVTVVHSDTAPRRTRRGNVGVALAAGGRLLGRGPGRGGARSRPMRSPRNVLEVDVADLEGPLDGAFRVAGAPDRRVTWAELAAAATERDLPLTAKGVYREPGSTFPFGAHVAVVQVDRETGEVDLLRHVAVDDCGRILNPMLVRGQQHGGIAQGIAQALFEEVVFDEVGNPMTSTLATYLMPSAADLPRLEASNTETPTDVNPLGAKGIGESGSIGATPAIQNAVVDALSHLGVRHVDLPCSPERVWQRPAGCRTSSVGRSVACADERDAAVGTPVPCSEADAAHLVPPGSRSDGVRDERERHLAGPRLGCGLRRPASGLRASGRGDRGGRIPRRIRGPVLAGGHGRRDGPLARAGVRGGRRRAACSTGCRWRGTRASRRRPGSWPWRSASGTARSSSTPRSRAGSRRRSCAARNGSRSPAGSRRARASRGCHRMVRCWPWSMRSTVTSRTRRCGSSTRGPGA